MFDGHVATRLSSCICIGHGSYVVWGRFFRLGFFTLLPLRIWGIMTNFSLIAVPLFIFMGTVLDKSGIAEDVLETIGALFGRLRGGLAVAVVLVGTLLATTTGVVGATVVIMGLIALPTMLKNNYSAELASGTVVASGTLGQIIPPSIILVLLGDVMGVPVGKLFMGAVVPGCLLVTLFLIYIILVSYKNPQIAPAVCKAKVDSTALLMKVLLTLIPLLLLTLLVLGTIFFGVASSTEAAAVGSVGAVLIAISHKRFSLVKLQEVMRCTTRLTSMVFMILIGATAFGLVFRGLGGGGLILDLVGNLPGGEWGFVAISMSVLFILGFFLDFLQICFIMVPIIVPVASVLGIDLLWFAVLIAMNLQTSFLTPPFGFSLFYLKAVVPTGVTNRHIYRGVLPYILLQITAIIMVILMPSLVTWLPEYME